MTTTTQTTTTTMAMTTTRTPPPADPTAAALPAPGDAGLGRFGDFGGVFVPELLVPPLEALADELARAQGDPDFQARLDGLLREWAGRPTPLTRMAPAGPREGTIYLKREDLLHGGAHKTNQVLAQALLARRLGKTRLIAETGAGQHGVATAMVGARLGFEVRVYMGALDVARQRQNVARMRLFGAQVVPVGGPRGTLRDAIDEAMRDWAGSFEDSHYVLGTAAGPHPYPTMVAAFQRVIGDEARRQLREAEGGRLPDVAVACVGGGSNAIGLFTAFLDDPGVRLVGVEAGGRGVDGPDHAAAIGGGLPGVLHGSRTMVLQDEHGRVADAHSVAAGLDYPAVGPEHAHLAATGRASYVAVTDDDALEAYVLLARREGILPALESAHAVAWALAAARREPDAVFLVNLSGRGDKDLDTVLDLQDAPTPSPAARAPVEATGGQP
jgi:tryptophan synthase beta chain